MWEEWRAAIDRSLRDGALTERRWYDPDFRAQLRGDPDTAKESFRLFSLTTTPGRARRELPRTWRLRLSASRARPVL
jgi:hypothetical protein